MLERHQSEPDEPIRRARDRLVRNAAEFDDHDGRERYLTNLPHNRRTMELACELLHESRGPIAF